jgi:hypothetical protein
LKRHSRRLRATTFKAAVYGMSTLLIQRGIYTHDEFEALFVEWVEKQVF